MVLCADSYGWGKRDGGQGLGAARPACGVRGVRWSPLQLELGVSSWETPMGPLWVCCQAHGSWPSPASLAPPAWLLPPQACASLSRCCWTRCPCWAMSFCSASSSSSSSASLVSSYGQGCFVTDASCRRISACECRPGGGAGRGPTVAGLGPTPVPTAVDIAVYTSVTHLVLKLGYTLKSSGELKKKFLRHGSPTGSDFIGLGFSTATAILTSSSMSLVGSHVRILSP